MLKSNKLIIFLISLPFLMLIVFYSLNGHPGYSDDSNFIRNHVAAIICNKIAIIKNGKIIASGNTGDVKGDESLEAFFMEVQDNE